MKVLLRFICLLAILTSCTSWFPTEPEEVKIAKSVIDKHAELQQENGLSLYSSGEDEQYTGKIKEFKLTYVAYEKVDVDAARELIVPAVDSLIELINDEPCLVPHLQRYPVDERNVSVGIVFLRKDDSIVYPPHIGFVLAAEERVLYLCKANFFDPFEKVYAESYEDALTIWEDANPACEEVLLPSED